MARSYHLLSPYLQAEGRIVGGDAVRGATIASTKRDADGCVDAEQKPLVRVVFDRKGRFVHAHGAVGRRYRGVRAAVLGEADVVDIAAARATTIADALSGEGSGDEREEEGGELHFDSE